jgi:UDP-glucuronate 4-epimerase
MILITGAAGFIGFHLANRLLNEGNEVCAIDNLNDYYDVSLKEVRLEILTRAKNFHFVRADISHRDEVQALFDRYRPEYVVHLAAQAGVRYSLHNPHAYVDSNVMGFLNILENCTRSHVEHLIYASSSSVYGGTATIPFSESQNVDHPISLYAATKKANELMAYTYSHLHNLPATGLRFFTVYGPYGRPDMAYFIFTKHILDQRPIDVYNFGKMRRDFTYIDDIVEGVVRLLPKAPEPAVSHSGVTGGEGVIHPPFKLYNIGNHKPVELLELIRIIESCLGKKATLNYLPLQPGEVVETFADITEIRKAVGFSPSTDIQAGMSLFVQWFLEFYRTPKRSLD